MTRLADALQRANLRRDAATEGAVAISAVPNRTARPSIPSAASGERRPTPAVGTSLIGMPSAQDELTSWRTDPELVGKLVGTDGVSAAALEQYRNLAAILHHAQADRGIKVIMTSSSLPGEGKSLTAINLALTLTESYHKRVFLIDADLRRPTVQRIFNLPTITGLTDGLKAEHDRPMPVTQISDRLFVLPAGRPDPDPLSGLTSDRMRRLVAQAVSAFDWVLIDTPPVGLLPDANLLGSYVDGVLLIVRAGKAPYQLVKRTIDALGHDRILGVVMNAVDFAHDRNAGGYYEYYGYGYYGVQKGK
jgi:capsular exopolysaccharide synthesis family protein